LDFDLGFTPKLSLFFKEMDQLLFALVDPFFLEKDDRIEVVLFFKVKKVGCDQIRFAVFFKKAFELFDKCCRNDRGCHLNLMGTLNGISYFTQFFDYNQVGVMLLSLR
jgi:hypothetical protein